MLRPSCPARRRRRRECWLAQLESAARSAAVATRASWDDPDLVALGGAGGTAHAGELEA